MLSTPFNRLEAEPKGGGSAYSRNASVDSVASRDSRSIMHSNENLTTYRINQHPTANHNQTYLHQHLEYYRSAYMSRTVHPLPQTHSGSATQLGQLASEPLGRRWDSAASNVSGTAPAPMAYPANVNPSYVPAGRGSYPSSESIAPIPVPTHRPAGPLPRKRNRLQEWKASCCRPLPLIICGVLILAIIAAIIAIAVTQSQANEERRFDNNGQTPAPYSANQQQLPQSIQNRLNQNGSGQSYGSQTGQLNGMQSSTMSASGGYSPNIQPPQVTAGQSQPNTYGNTMNVGQSSPNLYNNMQQSGSQVGNQLGNANPQQTNGNSLYNFPQNGQSQIGYGNGGMNLGNSGQSQPFLPGSTSVNNSPYAQNGQQRTPDNTGYAPNVMTAPNGGTGSNGQMYGMGGLSPSGQASPPSSGYVPNVAQQQNQQQQQPNNQFYGSGKR